MATPEGVDVDLVVAGVGSRFMSSSVDLAVEAVVIIPLLLAGAAFGSTGVAVAAVGGLLVVFGYPTACDAFLGGRTLGRRLTGLRLLTEEGTTVDVVPAALRNVVRLVDWLPAFYSVGVIACLASARNQRLGDMAAGTIVVRSDPVRTRAPAVPGARRATAGPDPVGAEAEPVAGADVLGPGAAGWDLTGLRPDDVTVVRSFLARRADLDPGARARVAAELARRLAPVVVGPDPAWGDEPFLEALVAARDERGR